MVQVHTCVSVHCGQCGAGPAGLGFEAHYPTEDRGARRGRFGGLGGRSGWTVVVLGLRSGAGVRGRRSPVQPVATGSAGCGCWGAAYRLCWRCCLHESRALALACTDVTGEVA